MQCRTSETKACQFDSNAISVKFSGVCIGSIRDESYILDLDFQTDRVTMILDSFIKLVHFRFLLSNIENDKALG